MDVEERTKVCRLIQTIIAADGVITADEREFLRKVAQRFEVPFELADVGPVPQGGPVSSPGQASEMLRQLPTNVQTRVMALLVESAIADGAVHPSEHALLLVAAAALGVDAPAVEERIADRLKRQQ